MIITKARINEIIINISNSKSIYYNPLIIQYIQLKMTELNCECENNLCQYINYNDGHSPSTSDIHALLLHRLSY